jgi:hypothetical protein
MKPGRKEHKDCVDALDAMAHHRNSLGFLRRMEFMEGTSDKRVL